VLESQLVTRRKNRLDGCRTILPQHVKEWFDQIYPDGYRQILDFLYTNGQICPDGNLEGT